MSCNWPTVELGKYCSKIGSGATPRGGSSVYMDSGEITLIRSQNIYNDGFKAEGLVYITPEAAQKLKNVIIEPNDILINITGDSVARVCLAPEDYLPARVNQHVAILRVKPDEFDHRYLRYFLTSTKMQNYLLTIASTGGTRNALTKSMLESLDVSKPPLSIQRKIGDVLERLENKISINTKTNQTLEEMAQAIFKSWFVDFDPVKAKVSGDQPEGIDAVTASLFPEKLVESELGLIPEGWEETPLYDIAEYINGAAYKKFEPNGEGLGLPIVKIAELKAGVTSKTGFSTVDMPQKYKLDDTDILFSWSGNPDTSIDTFVWALGEAWLNQHIFKVVPKSDLSRDYVLCLLKYMRPVFAEIARDKQTTGLGHVTVKDLKRLTVAVPSEELLIKFNEKVSAIIAHNFSLVKENQTLENLRDTLLPKLLSGEIDLGKTNPESIKEDV